MPGRGELVGRAYVQILADARQLDKEIKRYLKLQGSRFDKAADGDGARYANRFRQALREGDYGKAMGQALRQASRNVETSASALGDRFNAAFIAKMTGKNLRVGEILEKDIRDNFNIEDLLGDAAQLDRVLRTRLVAAERQFAAEARKATAELQEQDDITRRIDANMSFLASDYRRRQIEAINAAQRERVKILDDEHEKLVRIAAQNARTFNITSQATQYAADYERLRASTAAFNTQLTRATNATTRLGIASGGAHPPLSRVEQTLVRINTAARRTSLSNPFPRSRWLRPIGSFISLVTRVPSLLAGMALSAVRSVQTIAQAFATEGIVGGLKAIGGLTVSAATGFVTLGIAAVAFVVIAGLLATAISGIVGVLTALVSSVAIGTIGFLGALGPLALAAAIGVGALALAFTGNNDALKEIFQPFRRWIDAVRKPVKEALFANLAADVEKFEPVLGRLEPLLINSAKGLSQAFSNIADAFTSTGFLANIEKLQDEETGVPALLTKIGSALGLFGSGLVGLFTGILPTSQKLMDNIVDMAERFDRFANSTDGQNKIKDFFDDAWKSAKELGRVIGSAWDVIKETFLSGQDTGDSLLTSISDSLDRFAKFVEEGGLDKWFEDARQFATDLGPLMDNLGRLISALISPEAQARMGRFITFLSEAVRWIEKIVGWIQTAIGWIGKIAEAFRWAGEKIEQFINMDYDWEGIGEDIVNGIKDGISAAWDAFWEWARKKFDDFIKGVKLLFGIESPSKVFSAIGGDIMQGLLEGLIAGAVAVVLWFAGLPMQIIGALGSLGALLLGHIVGAVTAAWDGAYAYVTNTVIPWATALPGRIINALGNLAMQLIGKIGGAFSMAKDFVVNFVTEKLIPAVKDIPDQLLGALGDLATKIAKPFMDAYYKAKEWIDKLKNLASGKVTPDQSFLDAAAAASTVGGAAGGKMRGGWVTQPGMYAGAPIGERGLKEVVIPMELPINQVDPSVRWMAELIRGREWGGTKGRATGGVVGGGSGVVFEDGAVTIVAPQTDPVAAGMHMLNELAAKM